MNLVSRLKSSGTFLSTPSLFTAKTYRYPEWSDNILIPTVNPMASYDYAEISHNAALEQTSHWYFTD